MGKLLPVIIALIFPWQGKTQHKELAITHITVINIQDGRLLKNVSVLINGNRITGIGKEINIPANATVINATGKYLIPGLWDMHVHLSYYGEDAFPMLVANGITGVRDMGGNLGQLNKWKAEIQDGIRLGPRITMAGPFIDGPKKMNALRASFTRVVTADDEMRKVVDSLKDLHVDFLKVHSRLPRNAFFALAAEACKQHIPFAVHLPKDIKPEEAAAAGARSIEHMESLLGGVIYEEQETIREQRTSLILSRLYGKYGRQLAALIAGNKVFYDPTLISLFRVNDTGYVKRLAPRLLPLIRQLYLAGVRLLAGTDFAWKSAGIRPGYDLHDELVLFTKAGMQPLQALQAATINAVQCLYMADSLGSIEKGKVADLVLLNENPLTNIAHTKNICAVVLNGKYLSRGVLDNMLRK